MMSEGVSAEDSATLNREEIRVDGSQLPAIEDANQTQHHLQQESYHRRTTAVVGPEATDERATVNAEDVSGSKEKTDFLKNMNFF